MNFLKRFLTWWNSQTLGTQLFTRRFGQYVGNDAEGNAFYQNTDGSRRWVIYNGEMEASRVSPEWHGWLHYTYNDPPTEQPLRRKPWETPHLPNLTGTPDAYVPSGSLRSSEPLVRSDYVAWDPNASADSGRAQ